MVIDNSAAFTRSREYPTSKGPAPRVFEAAAYAVARKDTTKSEWGQEEEAHDFGATGDLIMPRATRAELFARCCAVCLLVMSRSGCSAGENCENKRNIEQDRGVRGQLK